MDSESMLLMELAALLVYGSAVVVIHELGHAALARAGGYRVTSFGIGHGPPIARLAVGGVVMHVNAVFFAGGTCVAIPVGPPGARRAWFHAGGLIAQALLALVLWSVPGGWWVERMWVFNGLVAVVNALPLRFSGQTFDGWYIIDALTGARREGSVLEGRSALIKAHAHQERIGSPLGAAWTAMGLAWCDLVAGRPNDWFEDVGRSGDPWVDAVRAWLLAAWHRQHGRPLAALRIVRDELRAQEDFATEPSTGLLRLAEAQALVLLDAPEQAERAVAQLAVLGGAIGRESTVVLLAAATRREGSDLEGAAWRVARHLDGSWLDPAEPIHALAAAAEEMESRGQLLAARGARQTAARMAERALAGLVGVDAAGLRGRLGPATLRRWTQAR